jgi:hypothetical protein
VLHAHERAIYSFIFDLWENFKNLALKMRQAIVSYDIKCTLNDVLQIIEPEEGK